MIYAVLADVHSNMEALDAVLARLAELPAEYDAVLCLGDLVGYGADPNACTQRVLAMASHTVRGNHDKVVAGIEGAEGFNRDAQAAVRWQRAEVSTQTRQRLRDLATGPVSVAAEVAICHGSPVDEDTYLLHEDEARDAFRLLGRKYRQVTVCLFGHTHIPMLVGDGPDLKVALAQPGEPFDLDPERRYLINPGSVGQPRDGDPRAAFGVLDAAQRQFTQYRVPYDIAAAQRKILAAGLPQVLAERLDHGH